MKKSKRSLAGKEKLQFGAVRATESAAVVTAAGNSEGAKKGWADRVGHHLHMGARAQETAKAYQATADAHQASEEAYSGSEDDPSNHSRAAKAHRKAAKLHSGEYGNKSMSMMHETEAERHEEYARSGKSEAVETDHRETIQAREVIHCKDSGIPLDVVKAKKTWVTGTPIDFQWLPGGISTLRPSLTTRTGKEFPIELTVNCTQKSAANVQNAFATIKANNPRRPPFGCIEHQAKERAFEPLSFEWRDVPEGGIYCTCEPSELGARNVNGRIHTSFSPTFDTDAEYHKLQCSQCKDSPDKCDCSGGRCFQFPKGARGSVSNPAEILAPDVQSVGSLTNWPAFRDILPIAARENAGVVQAAGTSEGVKKSWETRKGGAKEVTEPGHRIVTVAYRQVHGAAKQYPYNGAKVYEAYVGKDGALKAKPVYEHGPDRRSERLAEEDAIEHAKEKGLPFQHGIRQGHIFNSRYGEEQEEKVNQKREEVYNKGSETTSTETQTTIRATTITLDEAIRAGSPLDGAIRAKFQSHETNLDAAIRASSALASKAKQAPQLEQHNAETK